jgi:hypothetical protein
MGPERKLPAMQALDYFLPQPPFDLTMQKQTAFERLFGLSSFGSAIDYQLSYPKWQFLSYLCSTREFVLHGSQDTDFQVVEPRKAMDIKAISNQNAIYAGTLVFLFHHILCPGTAALVRGYGLYIAAQWLYPGSRAANIRCGNHFSTLALVQACRSHSQTRSPAW